MAGDLDLPVPLEPRPGPDWSRIRQGMARLPKPGFAVIDGALWDDAPAELERRRLFGRSLFLGAGRAMEAAGPYLVALDQWPDAAEAILNMTAERGGAVFWGGCAEQPLWRHLRTLNRAAIPAWAAEGRPGPSPEAAPGSVVVTFRHWDPGVLGVLMPLLDADQFARVLGPTAELLFVAPEGGGMRRVVADGAGEAPHGWLRLRSDQAEALVELRTDASDRRVAAFLREAAPEDTARRSDAELFADVVALRQSAQSMGVATERSQAWWAYLMVSTRGEVARSEPLMGYLRSGPGTADERMNRVRDHMLLLSRSERQAG